jgi:hypothetical protein
LWRFCQFCRINKRMNAIGELGTKIINGGDSQDY